MDLWYLYILKCRNGSFYTGITKDIKKRIDEHESGKGSKYLRGKGPLSLVFSVEVESKSMALKYEMEVKKISRKDKINLILSPLTFNNVISKVVDNKNTD